MYFCSNFLLCCLFSGIANTVFVKNYDEGSQRYDIKIILLFHFQEAWANIENPQNYRVLFH